MPSFVLEQRLAQEGIYARSGFHCAPLGHEALQTGIHGALRLSPGLFTTKKEISQTLFTLSRLAQEGV
jgi:selenocysteine lyase/cysteine desulfurase